MLRNYGRKLRIYGQKSQRTIRHTQNALSLVRTFNRPIVEKTLLLTLSILFLESCTNKERSDGIAVYTYEQMKHADPLGKTSLIDKKSRTVYKADNTEKGINIPDTPLFFRPTFYSDRCAIGILTADKIFDEKTDEIRDKRLKPMIDRLNEESNPILVIYKE